MKPMEELKKQVEAAANKEEARNAMEKAGMLLDDNDLDRVSGGVGVLLGVSSDVACPNPQCGGRDSDVMCLEKRGWITSYRCSLCGCTWELYDDPEG